MHYCHLHNSTAPLPLHHATAPLHALLLLHCITSLHHSTMPRHLSSHRCSTPTLQRCTPCSSPLHCLTNSSTPFHSITAPLRDLVASYITSLHHCMHYCHGITPHITAPLPHYSSAPHCSTPLHCLTNSSTPLHSTTSRHHYITPLHHYMTPLHHCMHYCHYITALI